MAPTGAAHLNLTVGGLLASGGAYGYFKSGSIPSLAAGMGCGGLMVFSGVLVDRDPQSAFLLGSGTSGLLTVGMLPRFLKTKKMMPTGMVALLGTVSLAYNGFQLSQWWDPEALPFAAKK
eukprot:gnl/TRDRNA2_/TRDRNA2_189898_c0_seq1.p1 gnl/TRDRNA2_/TRDRNA2_189898_c0~~gnl/TRDRNA2_/TRDRNA2_189898_c0_seq1.p1  ORF type:complete len:138 (-),score=28.03 gnl/TRDRNA2_/TRDRNA2_189898_c0_seq1:69-428(-)